MSKPALWLKLALFMFFFGLFTTPVLAFYGPFPALQRTLLGAIETSMHHRWIDWLVPPERAARILGIDLNGAGINSAQQSGLLSFAAKNDPRVELREVNGAGFRGYAVIVKDPTRLVVLPAATLPAQGQTTSDIARSHGALAAINAGGFIDNSSQGTGGKPDGVIIHEGKVLFGGESKKPLPLVGFTQRGALVIGQYRVEQMKQMRIQEAVSFGPPLIVDGKAMITQGDGGWGIAPRSAIGQRRDGSVILLAIDGRQVGSLGATLRQVQDIMLQLGAYNAVNLDGGSSTTLYYQGQVVNHPANLLGERHVPTVFAVTR